MIFGKNVFKEILGIDPFKRYKGGKKQSPPSSQLSETEAGKQAKAELYPWVESGMAGQGFGDPNLMAMRQSSARTGLAKSFDTTMGDFNSQMNRTVESGDTRVKNYAAQSLQRAYTSAQDSQNRGFDQEKISDKAMSEDMAGTLLSNEQRIGINSSQQYNNALSANFANQQQFGTFGTNLAGGLGAGMTDYYFAQKMGT